MQLAPSPAFSYSPSLLPLLISLADPFPLQRVVQDKHEASLGQKGRLKKANKAWLQLKTRMKRKREYRKWN